MVIHMDEPFKLWPRLLIEPSGAPGQKTTNPASAGYSQGTRPQTIDDLHLLM